MSDTKISAFRIELADPEALYEIEAKAPPELKDHFQRIKDGLEAIPGVPAEAFYGAVTLRALALQPDIFNSWFLTEYHSTKQGKVSPKIKELMAIIISYLNEEDENAACAPYHVGAARFEGASEAEIQAVQDYETHSSTLSPAVRTVIDFGIKSAFYPKEITDRDVQAIRDLGYSDAAVVEIISSALIAYNLSALNQVLNLREGAG